MQMLLWLFLLLLAGLGGVSSWGISDATSFASNAGGSVINTATQAGGAVVDTANQVESAVVDTATQIADAAEAAATAAVNSVKDAVTGALSGFGDGCGDSFNTSDFTSLFTDVTMLPDFSSDQRAVYSNSTFEADFLEDVFTPSFSGDDPVSKLEGYSAMILGILWFVLCGISHLMYGSPGKEHAIWHSWNYLSSLVHAVAQGILVASLVVLFQVRNDVWYTTTANLPPDISNFACEFRKDSARIMRPFFVLVSNPTFADLALPVMAKLYTIRSQVRFVLQTAWPALTEACLGIPFTLVPWDETLVFLSQLVYLPLAVLLPMQLMPEGYSMIRAGSVWGMLTMFTLLPLVVSYGVVDLPIVALGDLFPGISASRLYTASGHAGMIAAVLTVLCCGVCLGMCICDHVYGKNLQIKRLGWHLHAVWGATETERRMELQEGAIHDKRAGVNKISTNGPMFLNRFQHKPVTSTE